MLKEKVQEGFYKTRDGRIACVTKIKDDWCWGQIQTKTGIADVGWSTATGSYFEKEDSPYDLVERLEC